ncbi:polyprotein [Tapara virus]|uniref:Envelopment polyprotein n=1 Tax=Tapara virus TaxID=1926501 RepID=A0A1S5SHW2_9VIRU|nr:polyprotein [Tapara virus]API68893.1 polyprotein [Tapara virus]
MKYFIVLTILGLVDATFKLATMTPNRKQEVCIDSGATLNQMQSIWDDLNNSLATGTRSCTLEEGTFSFVNERDYKTLLQAVFSSDVPLKLDCVLKDDYKQQISFETDGDLIPKEHPSIVNCKTRAYISDIRPRVEHPEERTEKVAASGHSKRGMTDDERALEEELRALLTKKEIYIMNLQEEKNKWRLLGEYEDVKEKLTSSRNNEEKIKKMIADKDELILHLESEKNENRISKISHDEMRHKIKKLENSLNREKEQNERDMVRLKSSGGIVTTILPIISAVTLLASPALAIDLRHKNSHARNRVGSGNNVFPGLTDDTCSLVDYNVKCYAFEVLLNRNMYPFSSSHIHKRTVLEAFNDKIIEKNEGRICEMKDTKRTSKCDEEKSKIKAHCPNNFMGAHYLDSDGKLSGIYCESDKEITEDCKFCRSVKSGSTTIRKATVQMQDAMCQEGDETYDGPYLKPKGFCKIGVKTFKECTNYHSEFLSVPFFTTKNKGKIYLDKLILRNDDASTAEGFICYDHLGQVDGERKQETETRQFHRISVKRCNSDNETQKRKCSGDEFFCKTFDCTTNYPDTYCMAAPGSGDVLLHYAGTWIKPVCFGYENALVSREVTAPLNLTEEECIGCSTQCLKHGISVSSTGFLINSAIACSHGHCITKAQTPSTLIEMNYPGMSKFHGGDIGIHLSHNDDTVSSHLVVHCESRDSCGVNECLLCYHSFINYHCHTVLSGLIVFVFLSGASLLIIKMLIILSHVIKMLPSRITYPVSWLFTCCSWLTRKMKSKARDMRRRINDEIGWDRNVDVEAQAVNPARFVRVRGPLPRYGKFMTLMCLITVASSCSELVMSNSKMTKCLHKNGKTTCSVSGTVILRAGSIGSEACFMIKGPSENQKKHISITTLASELTCREGDTYWTSHYSPECFSSRRCHLVSECVSNQCQSWDSNVISNEFSKFANETAMSENRCFEQCGGWACGCFSIQPSCLFVHSRLNSVKKEALRVFNCIDWVHKITFSITSIDGSKEKFSLNDMGSKFFQWGTFSLGLQAEGISATNPISFMQHGKSGFALLDEEFSRIPRAGFIGEVRCSSEASAILAHKSCLRAPQLIKYRPMTDRVDCTSALVDPFIAFKRGSLPQERFGKMFTPSVDKTTVQAVTKSVIEAEIRLTFEGYEVEFENEVSECEASFLNITGCYSCNEGARVCLKIKSESKGTLISHSNDNSMNVIMRIEEGITESCQIIHLSNPEVDEELRYTCGELERSLRIKGTLVAVSPYDDRVTGGGESSVVNPKTSDWSILGWITGFSSWMGGPLKAIGLIILYVAVSILILFFMAFLIRNFITSWVKNKLGKKE